MAFMLGYKQERVFAAVGEDGTVFTSNGEYGEWSEPEVTDADLALKANIASPTFTGTVTLPAVTQSGTITANGVAITPTELGYVGTLTSDAQTQINAKANAANPVFTGTVTIPDGALAIADTSGLQSALDLKAPLASPTFTGTVTLPDVTASGTITANSVAITPTELGYVGTLTSDAQTQLNGKVNDTGDTITGLLTITADGDPIFRIEGTGGNDIVYVTQTYNELDLANGASLVIYAGPGLTNETVRITGSSGNVTTSGSVIVTDSNSSAVRIEQADGTDVVNVNSTSKNFELVNAADLTMYSGNYSGTVFAIDGANGNTTIAGALDHDGTTVGFFGKTPATQPAANADTSGASLATLETEVNQIKAALRSLGIIAT